MLDFLKQDQDPSSGRVMRRVRSFVLRQGRLTPGQRQAIDTLWPRYGLERSDGVLEPEKVFGRCGPLVFEIGYGMGHSLVRMALAEPDWDFLGVEVHRPGVGALLMAAAGHDLGNLRTWCDDAVDILEHCIADEALSRVQLYFPDPWHKRRHRKRRIVQPAFVALVRRKLSPGGLLHMATDWEDYALHMAGVMRDAPGWTSLASAGDFVPRPDWRPLTRFERRGARLGHGVRDLLHRKDG